MTGGFFVGLGEHAHFSNFGMAFLTLFRVATGDNWNGIMKDTLREDCDDSTDCVKNCCVSTVIAPIFFVIFVLMAQFVLVNVVVAVSLLQFLLYCEYIIFDCIIQVLMKHLEESHKHLEDEQDMDTQLEREFQQKQDLQERKELYLALQLDSECVQPYHKPLTKVRLGFFKLLFVYLMFVFRYYHCHRISLTTLPARNVKLNATLQQVPREEEKPSIVHNKYS